MKTAKVAGLKSGKGNKRNKYHFPSNNKSMTSPGRMSLAQMANMDLSNENLAIDDDLSGKSHLRCFFFFLIISLYSILSHFLFTVPSSGMMYIIVIACSA